MKKSLAIFCLFVVLGSGCTKDEDPPNNTIDCNIPKNFSVNVNPIIQTTCASDINCHAAGSFNGPGALTSYQQIFNARVGIRTAVISRFMPQNSSLTTAQINTIVCWIDNGAPNN
jgi:hypothetical protein